MSAASTSTGGYTCCLCHQWVPLGAIHQCGRTPPPLPTVTVSPSPGEALLAAALNRVAAALERLALGADE